MHIYLMLTALYLFTIAVSMSDRNEAFLTFKGLFFLASWTTALASIVVSFVIA